RRDKMGERVEEGRDRSARLCGELEELARGQDTVVDPVPVLPEEHVPRDLAAEEDAVVAHLLLEVRMAGLPHDRLAAVSPDVVGEGLGGLDVEDHLGARVTGEKIAREEGEDQVGLVTTPAIVD